MDGIGSGKAEVVQRANNKMRGTGEERMTNTIRVGLIIWIGVNNIELIIGILIVVPCPGVFWPLSMLMSGILLSEKMELKK